MTSIDQNKECRLIGYISDIIVYCQCKRKWLKGAEPQLNKMTVGMFGTCGSTTKWREPFIAEYEKRKIPYFNPNVANWDPANAKDEAWHLANDELILFPVTNETYGLGSLSEIGFSIMQAIKMNRRRFVIVMISPDLLDSPKLQDPDARRASLTQRALVKAHLEKLDYEGLYIVNSLEEMLSLSLDLYTVIKKLHKVRKYKPVTTHVPALF